MVVQIKWQYACTMFSTVPGTGRYAMGRLAVWAPGVLRALLLYLLYE